MQEGSVSSRSAAPHLLPKPASVPASEVDYITNENTCKTAGREYKKAIGCTGSSPAVHVIRVGARFLVTDPNEGMGEWTVAV